MIFVNTNLAAATGAVIAMIVSWIKLGKPEVGMSLNGALAGLVGITAGCANVSPGSAIIIGGVAGILVVFSVLFLIKLKLMIPWVRFPSMVYAVPGAPLPPVFLIWADAQWVL